MYPISRGGGPVPRPGAALSHGFFAGIVFLCDVASILLCGLVFHVLYFGNLTHNFQQNFTAMLLFGLVCVLALHATGLYRFTAIVDPKRQVLRICVIFAGVFLLLTAAAFALKVSADFSRMWAFAWLVSSVACVVLCRIMVAAVIRSLRALRPPGASDPCLRGHRAGAQAARAHRPS